MPKIKILVADDHEIVRKGLRELINQQSDMEVVSEAKDGEDAVRMVRQYAPDVVLMDVVMPNTNGIEATKEIKSQFPQTRIIALSIYADRSYVIQMFKMGVSGYLLKESAFNELIKAIRKALNNQVHLSYLLFKGVYLEFQSLMQKDTDHNVQILNQREQTVLKELSDANSMKEIGERMNTSVDSIESVIESILNKWMLINR
ncbi:MAG: response regulator transcription factor [bacterium]